MIAAVASAATLAASPGRVRLEGASSRRIVVSDRGAAVSVTAAASRFPRATSSAVRWVSVRPRRFVLRPHAPVALTVAARPRARAKPGSYDALVLLTAVLPRAHGVAVRLRLGVHVVVVVPRTRIRATARVHSEHARDRDRRPSQYRCRICLASVLAVPARSRMRSTALRARGWLSFKPKG